MKILVTGAGKNGFVGLFSSEEQERKFTGLKSVLTKKQIFYNRIMKLFHFPLIEIEKLSSRLMFFDLIVLKK